MESHREAAKTALLKAILYATQGNVDNFDAAFDRLADSLFSEMEQRIVDKAYVYEDRIGMA